MTNPCQYSQLNIRCCTDRIFFGRISLMRRVISFLSILCVFGPAFAVKTRNLHYGEKSEPLFSDRKSTPALIVQIEEVLHYGYLTPGVVSGKLIIEKSPGERYSLTVPPSCAPGTYSEDSYIPCQPCGIGHYCTGGSHRAACTWGACGCTGTDHASDNMSPSGCSGILNREMTLAEVEQWIPVTDMSQWQKLSDCSSYSQSDCSISTLPGYQELYPGCAAGTIGPGTYLFILRVSACPGVDVLSGHSGVSSVRMIIFDHPVSYKSLHVCNSISNWVDLNNIEFTSHSFVVPLGGYCSNNNYTNLTGLPGSASAVMRMYVYELK